MLYVDETKRRQAVQWEAAMIKLISMLIVFALAPAAWAHDTEPVQGGLLTMSYLGIPGPGRISVTHFAGEPCVVTAQAVEVFVGTPLLSIQSTVQQPALDVFLSITAIRHPANGSETTTVRLNWSATGFTVDGMPDAGCNGFGEVFFDVTVIEGVPGTNPPPPTTPGTNDSDAGDPVSTATGSLYDFFDDLYLRGPMPLMFSRYYSSSLIADGGTSGTLGVNWMHNFDLHVSLIGATATVTYYQGQNIVFGQVSGTVAAGSAWQLTSASPLVYQLISIGSFFRFLDPANNHIYTFNAGAGGRLERIEDRNGNVLTLTYSGNLLSHVGDGLGATLDFTYTPGGKLANVKDQSGRTVSFTYSGNNLASSTDPKAGATTYAYTTAGSNSGLLLSATLPRGNVPYSQTYDSNGRTATQTDASGNATSFAYGSPAAGQTTVTDPLLAITVFQHQGVNLVGETGPYPNSSTRTYDASNRITSQQDNAGNRVTFTYHAASGQLASLTEPDGTTISFTYIATSSGGFTFYDVASVAFPGGTSESYVYDTKGNLTSRTDRAGQTWQVTYNSRGQILSLHLPTGAVQTYTYNADATLATITVPGAGTASFTYDSVKRITQKTRTNGVTRNFAYDALNGLTLYTDADGAASHFTRDANGFALSTTDALGGTNSTTRTGNDLVTGITDAAGHSVQIGYDKLQRMATLGLQDGSALAFGHDAAGNVASFTDGEGKVWHRGYDQNRRPISLATPLGNTTNLTRDSVGRVTAVDYPLGVGFQFTYDAAGRATSVTDEAGSVTQLTYNGRGFVTGISLAPNVSASYTRNSLGQITDIRDPNGNHWLSSYDTAGRLMSLTDPLGNAQTFTRNARGRITGVVSPAGTTNFTTNAAGRVTQATSSDGTSLAFAYNAVGQSTTATGAALEYDIRGLMSRSNGIDVQRDNAGRVVQLTLAAGKTVQYTYDHRNLLVQVHDWLGSSTTFTYDDDGRLLTIARPNGITTTYGYDAEGQITSIAENAGSNSVSSVVLARDGWGRTLRATRNVPLAPTADQLTAISGSHTFDAASQIVGFNYDSLGRRLLDNHHSYNWDLDSRLKSYTAGTQTSLFGYNAFGHLISETVGSSARQYVLNYASDLPSLAVVRQSSSDLRYNVHTPAGELLYSIGADGSRRYYHFDEMGNTLFLTDATGTITDSYAYSPFGEPLASTGISDNSFTFAGRYGVHALGSGLYSMGRRVYDSATGNFISRDPVARLDPRLINPYQYAAGNPLAYVDKTGEDPSTPGITPGDVASGTITAAGQASSVAAPIAQHLDETVNTILIGVRQAKSYEETPAEINAAYQAYKKLQTVPKLETASSKLKVVGKVGNALQLVNVAIEGVKLNSALDNGLSEYDNNRDAAQKAYDNMMLSLFQLYCSRKISLVDYRRRRMQMINNYEDARLASDSILDDTLWLSGANFVKDSLTAMTPVPGAAFDQLTNFGSWVIGK
jgi:RHS repeat-associated protein